MSNRASTLRLNVKTKSNHMSILIQTIIHMYYVYTDIIFDLTVIKVSSGLSLNPESSKTSNQRWWTCKICSISYAPYHMQHIICWHFSTGKNQILVDLCYPILSLQYDTESFYEIYLDDFGLWRICKGPLLKV